MAKEYYVNPKKKIITMKEVFSKLVLLNNILKL